MAQNEKSTGSVKILSIVWYKVLPAQFGGQKGVALFNEFLAQQLPLACICSRNNQTGETAYPVKATLPINQMQFFNPLVWWRIYKEAKRESATHLLLEFPYHAVAGIICKHFLSVKLIVHEHNIESLRFKNQGKWWWKGLFALEKWVLRKADVIFFKTDKERQQAIGLFRLNAAKTSIVPYGIALKPTFDHDKAKREICRRHQIAPETKLLLFAGTLDYGPNADAVNMMMKEVVPLLNSAGLNYLILLCGRIEYPRFAYLKNIKDDRLLYAGRVTDIDAYFAAADVFVNPVSTGGGVQTKVIDALSFDLNVVCFEQMTAGIAGGEPKLFIAKKDDWKGFAAAIIQALQTNTPTPACFFEWHDWNNIAEKAARFILEH